MLNYLVVLKTGTTESAIRLLSSFKASGLLDVKGRRIRIIDTEGLEHASQGYN